MTLQALVREARVRIAEAGVPSGEAARDADLLARHALGWEHASFIARLGEAAPPGFRPRYEELIARRALREPVAYIRGLQEFWGRDFLVRRGVLIPRPETELIVEEALDWASTRPANARLRVLDIGTGSGCLAITLALELPGARLSATDLSGEALAVARANAERLGADVTWHAGPYQASAQPPFDLVVSNPPYVGDVQLASLQPEVRDFEPATALAGGSDGLSVIRQIVAQGRGLLAPEGRLVMEIGQGQAAAVAAAVADTEGLELLRIREDLQGIPRVVVTGRSRRRATSAE